MVGLDGEGIKFNSMYRSIAFQVQGITFIKILKSAYKNESVKLLRKYRTRKIEIP